MSGFEVKEKCYHPLFVSALLSILYYMNAFTGDFLSARLYHLRNYISNMIYLCGLVVRVLGSTSRGPRFDFRRYQIFRDK
jgi:uncharacterized membrane protein YoaT (DUF817 family)